MKGPQRKDFGALDIVNSYLLMKKLTVLMSCSYQAHITLDMVDWLVRW